MAIVLTRQEQPWPVAVLAGLLTGAFIGACIGLLVARLGIPSFVVTLAAFLGLQGVLLQLIGEGGTIPVRDETLLALGNDTLPVPVGWAFSIGVVLVYAAVSLRRAAARRAGGLHADALSVVLAKALALASCSGRPPPTSARSAGRGRRSSRSRACPSSWCCWPRWWSA
jgi:D-xylose transport system permease protein